MAAMPNPFVNEEVALFVGIAFESIFYGITVLLFFLTLRNLYMRGGSRKSSGSLWRLMGVLSIQQIALLIAIIGNIQFGVLAFVHHRDIPGGPVVYQITHSNVPPAYAALSAFSICNWLQDGVLLYRFRVIFNGWNSLFVLGCMLFMTSLAFNLILLIQLGGHAGLLNVGTNLPVSTIYFSLSVGLNVILTLLIIGRIIHRARLTTDQPRLPKQYVSILAMVIESAALSAVTGLILIVTLHTDVAPSIAVEALYGVMTVLSPVLIAYRVSTGDAWSRDTTQRTGSTGNFVAGSGAGASRTVLGNNSEILMMKSRDSGRASEVENSSVKGSERAV
jgi:hypothetical protein